MAELVRLPDPAIVVLRCMPASLAAAGAALEVDFPRAHNRFAERAGLTLAAVSPDNWLVIADDGNALPIVDKLQAALFGYHAAVVDVSGNRVRYRLSGENTRDMMARACALDLDPPHFSAGHCAGTLVARAQVYILQRDNTPIYEILVPRSFAKYLSDWFDTAGCHIT